MFLGFELCTDGAKEPLETRDEEEARRLRDARRAAEPGRRWSLYKLFNSEYGVGAVIVE